MFNILASANCGVWTVEESVSDENKNGKNISIIQGIKIYNNEKINMKYSLLGVIKWITKK